MKERPILFSAPMVRAILAGTKTQTRRMVKPQPPADELVRQRTGQGFHLFTDQHASSAAHFRVAGAVSVVRELCGASEWVCPYGAPGDRLWVRETWRPQPDNQCERITYAADGAVAYENEIPDAWRRPVVADRGNVPSIHMPRWASRITLEVTGVRVERLQAITQADARAEGVVDTTGAWEIDRPLVDTDRAGPRGAFEALWEFINGAESWTTNPWVWVVEFKRVTP